MAVEVTVPALGLEMKPGLIAEWYVPDGAEVASGQAVYCLESDFVTFDVEAEHGGILRHRFDAGESFAPGTVVAFILDPGERMPEVVERGEPGVEPAPEPVAGTGSLWFGDPAPPPAAPHAEVPDGAPEPDYPPEHEAPHDEAPRGTVVEMPLRFRRNTLPEPPPPPSGSIWEAFTGTGHGMGFSLSESVSGRELPGQAESDDAAHARPADADAGPAEYALDSAEEGYAEHDLYGAADEQPVPEEADDPDGVLSWLDEEDGPGRFATSWDLDNAPVKDPSAPLSEARFEDLADDIAAEAYAPEPILLHPSMVEHHANEPVDGFVPAIAPLELSMRITVAFREARKMREQLQHEWRNTGIVPTDEDIIVRSFARAAMEQADLAAGGDSIGVVFVEEGGERVAVLDEAAHGSFRERVQAFKVRREAGEGGFCALTITSFAAFGIDEGTPPLPEGHPAALGVGAVRPAFEHNGDELVPAPTLVLTLAYAPDRISVAGAAALLARVRELLEAPYALLAD
jgi:pyruvate/2-oxoglutarate dehydrogenase complex dihydrolipoamide acyltransferase (E2) component